jgi:hypothetical protein
VRPSTAGIEEVAYAGHDAVRLTREEIQVHVATGFGPRVIGLELADSGNLFAILPDAWLPAGDGTRFRFRGGHRLWQAPEVPATTYRPDDRPVAIELADGWLRAVGPRDDATGLRRSIGLLVDAGGVRVRHEIANEGSGTVRLAPWAITQLPVGGRAWLPLAAVEDQSGDSPLPDRLLVLWPYTDLVDPRIRLLNRYAEIDAVARHANAHRLKLGAAGAGRRLAYLRDGWLFEKEVDAAAGEHADLGAAAQIYADERFLELETLGPLAELGPGQSASHHERWAVVMGFEACLVCLLKGVFISVVGV